MTTVSFKADDDFKETLNTLSRRKGINLSAYIKLLLTQSVQEELARMTPNGLTVAEELEILKSDMDDDIRGPFSSSSSLIKSLRR